MKNQLIEKEDVSMAMTSVIEQNTESRLSEEFLLRSVIDVEFREQFLSNADLEMPIPVLPQDMSFVELIKDSVSIQQCISTCVSGFTIICDGNTLPDNCRNTCISGYTIRCDGNTL